MGETLKGLYTRDCDDRACILEIFAVTRRMGWKGMKLGGEDEMSKLKNQAGQ